MDCGLAHGTGGWDGPSERYVTNIGAMSMKKLAIFLLAAAIVSSAGASAALAKKTATVRLSLGDYATLQHASTGDYVGVSPGVITVHVGDSIVFVNSDNRHHTASSIAGARFPQEPKWSADELKPGGAIGAVRWSTGDLAPGARSAPITATKPGTFLYGCFFDYTAGMRGTVIVEP